MGSGNSLSPIWREAITWTNADLLSNGPSSEIWHYGDVIMGEIASQITSLAIVYSAFYSGADQRKHQSSASVAIVGGGGGGGGNSPGTGEFPPHKWPVTWKCFHLMTSSWMGVPNLSFMRMDMKMSSAKWRQFCPGEMSWYDAWTLRLDTMTPWHGNVFGWIPPTNQQHGSLEIFIIVSQNILLSKQSNGQWSETP